MDDQTKAAPIEFPLEFLSGQQKWMEKEGTPAYHIPTEHTQSVSDPKLIRGSNRY